MGKTLNNYAKWRQNENCREYSFYFEKYYKMITNLFKWNNLPDGISARYIEDKLFYNGELIFFKSKHTGFYVVSTANAIGFNQYEEPTKYLATGLKVHEYISAKNCVPIWNNNLREGNFNNVHFFAKKLSEIEKTISVNMEQMKNPYIVKCPEGQKSTVEAIFKFKEEGVPYIMVDKKGIENIEIDVIKLDVKNFTRELMEVKQQYDSDGLTFFGINNVNINKKERLITGEADGNNEQINLNKESMLKARKESVEKINEKFGLDISVDLCENINKGSVSND